MVSDQQLVTGISIMSVGYIQRCTITRYHFYIIYLLGFISCQIYDASLCVLNLYVNKRRAMKIWRAILMSVLFGMVIINSFVVENDDFLTNDGETWYFGSSTQCTWNNLVGTDHYQHDLWILIVTLGVLFWGYLEDFRLFYPGAFWWLKWVPRIFQLPLSSLLRLYGWIDKQTREPQQLYTGPRHIDEEARPIVAHLANFLRRVIFCLSLILMQSFFWILFIPTFTSMEVLRSRTTSIWRIYLGLFWASMQVLRTRANARSSNVIKGSEDEWGFGQVLPLLLLILPGMSLLEVYQGK
ncbi:hypothetical protein F5Y13DRAFT_173041 [Hypoxylon sp. FL1857]|nr:hypothetical protein F5Y13DRAFT_173041 [Hypoxylon sp. FL1857]